MSNLPSPSDFSDDGTPGPGTTPTPTSQLHRSVSHGSHWNAPDTPHHHHIGTSYFPAHARPVSPAPRHSGHPSMSRSMSANSTRRGHRSTSVSSSQATSRGLRDDEVGEEDEDSEGDEDDSDRTDRRSRGKGVAAHQDEEAGEDDDDEEDPITLKDRQSLINVEHPFGLPIWKPALYKKSRSVTRYADEALHSVPSAQAERHLLPGNILWTAVFGWWLSLVCFAISGILYVVPLGGRRYSSLVWGLGWYLAWPFGKYVEGDLEEMHISDDEELDPAPSEGHSTQPSNGVPVSQHSTITPNTVYPQHSSSVSWGSVPNENTSLLPTTSPRFITRAPSKVYGATLTRKNSVAESVHESQASDLLGKGVFWLALVSIIAPLMLAVCIICWGLVITIPMAKLNWALIQYLFRHPTSIRFCAAPPAVVVSSPHVDDTAPGQPEESADQHPQFSVKHPRLAAGQTAPTSPASTVLLCTYRAIGLQYYKYTVGGVNILFVNLLPIVFFVIFDGNVLLPLTERREEAGKHVPAFLAFIASRAVIFILSLMSVIPLSYFIGMAVASISAQSSIGMGAVINATFGSIIEIILYGMALTQGKGHLVEGSIVGSLLAGVLLMPGLSMVGGAIRRKEQKFNAKSAGVTSMMLIMAIIGTLTPTLFYQVYGNFQLICDGCPDQLPSGSQAAKGPWVCDHCYYQHPDPVDDPFYQSTVKSLMYFCAAILLFSYLIGLWFSLRTHATQIWQNPQQLLHPLEIPAGHGHNRFSIYNRNVSGNRGPSLNRKSSNITNISTAPSRSQTPVPRDNAPQASGQKPPGLNPPSPVVQRRVSHAIPPNIAVPQAGYTPVLESVDQALKTTGLQPMQLPEQMTTEDFTRAVAVATVSALRHQQNHSYSPARARNSAAPGGADAEVGSGGHGGHEGPSWSRTTSASVLLGCTALYAIIAELLVDVVDVILEGSGIDEKFLGITLFALVPNTTEFMNAISFAVNGNIALSMEIGSAYALQVCLLQIPAMVAFSAWYAPDKMGKVSETFTLIFPRWDVIVIILSMFLMTYTYIEAKSNYHRGSILILSYLVLAAGFYFAPHVAADVEAGHLVDPASLSVTESTQLFFTSLWS
ncbi:hypothetical protein PLICRDRAFT_113470 [Plicaturopsis crispa FD-325 SS-3]|nr:hypothetical protein PLICRDRAFT_113470 [Plicaturopsis crispa FD-325 SS-3]